MEFSPVGCFCLIRFVIVVDDSASASSSKASQPRRFVRLEELVSRAIFRARVTFSTSSIRFKRVGISGGVTYVGLASGNDWSDLELISSSAGLASRETGDGMDASVMSSQSKSNVEYMKMALLSPQP